MYYKTAHAVCRGSAHIAMGVPCQDVTAAWNDDGCGAIVLCDGAGSCSHALEGAQAVSEGVLALLQRWCRSEAALTPEAVLYTSLQSLSRNPYPIREQSCTLLLCGVRENGEYVLGHIGDGCGFIYDGADSRLISRPENGSNPGETFFVTGLDAPAHLRMTTGTLHPGEGIALCSDGASASLYNHATMQPAPAVARLCQWLRENPSDLVSRALEENLDEVLRRHSHDDMSVALLLCCEQERTAGSEQDEPARWDPEDTEEWEEIPDEGDSYV